MYLKKQSLLALIISCSLIMLLANPSIGAKGEDCANELLPIFDEPANSVVPAEQIKNTYKMFKDLRSASKSGAFPALVKEGSDLKFLKIFPKLKKGEDISKLIQNTTFLEMLLSCRLARLDTSYNLPANVKASKFFVDLYRTGFLKTGNPFDGTKEEDAYYPFLVGESVPGVTLTKLAAEPTAAQEALGFQLFSAPPKVLESILLQIIVALKNGFKRWGITHNDIHTGNIILSKAEKANFKISNNSKEMQLAGPLVKIIDFGLGQSSDFKQDLKSWIKYRPVIKELEKFIDAAWPGQKIPLSTRTAIYNITENQDIQMFNLIIQGLKEVLNLRKKGSVPDGKYCKDYDDCINLVSSWWN